MAFAASSSKTSGPDRPGKRTYLEQRLYSRTLADDVTVNAPADALDERDGTYGLEVLAWDDENDEWTEQWVAAKAKGDTFTIVLPQSTIVRERELTILRDDTERRSGACALTAHRRQPRRHQPGQLRPVARHRAR